MILSRCIERVKKQYRADAFVEPAMVIPGVFIRPQANSRNAARHDRAPENRIIST